MRDTIRYEFSYNESNLVLKSLNLLRSHLVSQEEATIVVDDIIGKLGNNKVDFDIYEMKIIIKALNNYRYKLKNMGESRTEVNDILLKMIDDTENCGKKKVLLRILTPGNGRC